MDNTFYQFDLKSARNRLLTFFFLCPLFFLFAAMVSLQYVNTGFTPLNYIVVMIMAFCTTVSEALHDGQFAFSLIAIKMSFEKVQLNFRGIANADAFNSFCFPAS